MKKLVIYYSYTGNTKKIATDLAQKENVDILEITDIKKPSKIGAYVKGCFSAMRMKPSKINPISTDLSNYDVFTLISPIWAGHSTPQINAVIYQLPANKKVEMILVSASGQSAVEEKIKNLLQNKNCELIKCENIKA